MVDDTLASPAPVAVQSATAPATGSGSKYLAPLAVLTTLFFMWGFLTCLNDIIIPHLKAVFDLNYAQAMLIQLAFFTAYFIVSLPSGSIVNKLGYKNGILIGLVTAGCGCLLFYPAAGAQSFGMFLLALFVLASGITLLQVAANPFVAILGQPETASSRLTMTQALNSLGTTIAPLFGSVLIMSQTLKSSDEMHRMAPAALDAYRVTEASSVQGPYVGLAIALVVLAVAIGFFKLPKIGEMHAKVGAVTYVPVVLGALGLFHFIRQSVGVQTAAEAAANRNVFLVLMTALFICSLVIGFFQLPKVGEASPGQAARGGRRACVLGALGIFLYVGAEVAIGSFLVNYFKEPGIGGLSEAQGARYVSLYWGGAMVGRFIGSFFTLRKFRPGRVLGPRRRGRAPGGHHDAHRRRRRDVDDHRRGALQLDHVPDDLHHRDRRPGATHRQGLRPPVHGHRRRRADPRRSRLAGGQDRDSSLLHHPGGLLPLHRVVRVGRHTFAGRRQELSPLAREPQSIGIDDGSPPS